MALLCSPNVTTEGGSSFQKKRKKSEKDSSVEKQKNLANKKLKSNETTSVTKIETHTTFEAKVAIVRREDKIRLVTSCQTSASNCDTEKEEELHTQDGYSQDSVSSYDDVDHSKYNDQHSESKVKSGSCKEENKSMDNSCDPWLNKIILCRICDVRQENQAGLKIEDLKTPEAYPTSTGQFESDETKLELDPCTSAILESKVELIGPTPGDLQSPDASDGTDTPQRTNENNYLSPASCKSVAFDGNFFLKITEQIYETLSSPERSLLLRQSSPEDDTEEIEDDDSQQFLQNRLLAAIDAGIDSFTLKPAKLDSLDDEMIIFESLSFDL